MKKHIALAISGVVAPFLTVTAAKAQTVVTTPAAPPPATVVTTPAAPPPATVVTTPAPAPAPQTNIVATGGGPRETVVASGPNALLLKSGLFTFGIPYGASVVVAAESNRDEDRNLYIPVVGPWVDFGDRRNCGNVNQPSCSGETAVKVLLAADGIFQAIGAIELISAFMVPEGGPAYAKADPKPHVTVAPAVGRAGYGLAAVGSF
jgi:hypothetical protein